MRRIVMIVGGMLLAAAPAQAQLPGINVHVGARAGLYTPLGDLVVGTKVKSGLGIGASIELDIPFSPINVRANVDAAMGRGLEVDGHAVEGPKVDIVAITGDLVFRPLPRIVVLQPYFLAGAGVKRYSFERMAGAEDKSNFTGHIGAGADMKLGPIGILGEISDYISSYESGLGDKKLQNDVFITVGFRIGML
jgi:hypothetical protein